jgi:multiple sugar transport system substrate-binding protein
VVKETVEVEVEVPVKETELVEVEVTAQPGPVEPVQIRLATWGDVTDKEVYENIVADLAAEDPSVQGVVEQYPGGHYDKIQANFAAGTSAEVLYFQGWSWQPFADNGVLLPLDEFIDMDDAGGYWPDIENYRVNTQRNGLTYMSVADTGSCIMFYVKDVFDKAGVPYPTDDWTYEDFQAMVEATSFEEGGIKYYGYAQALNWNGAYLRCLHWMRMNGALEWDRVDEPTQAKFDQDEIIDALQFVVVDTIANGWCPTPDTMAGGGVTTATARVAMNVEGTWTLANFQGPNAAIEGGTAFGVVAMPKGSVGEDLTVAEVHGHVMAISCLEREAAWKLMKFIMEPQGQERVADGGRMCGTPEMIEELWVPRAQETYHFENGKAFADSMRTGGTPIVAGAGANYDAIAGTGAPINTAWEAMLYGTSAREALTEANPLVQAILDEYWADKEA